MPFYEGIGFVNEKLPVVIEIGQAFTKAGFAGEIAPRCVIPSAVPSKAPDRIGKYDYLHQIQNETELYQALVEFIHNLYFKHILVTPKERKVVLVESIFAGTRWREVLAKVLFLHYEVLTILYVPTQMGGVTATGGDTALIVDIGNEDAFICPLVSGVTMLSNCLSHDLGAIAFDSNLRNLLTSNCTNYPKEEVESLLDEKIVEEIRLRACFVTTVERAEQLENGAEPNPILPTFKFEKSGELFLEFRGIVREQSGEIWFQNKDLDGISVPAMILATIARCPIDTRHNLAKSILLCGGTSMLPGFKKRLIRELKKLVQLPPYNSTFNDTYEFRIFDPPCPQNIVSWFGGAVYGSTEVMNLRGVTKESFLRTGRIPDWPDFANYTLTLPVPAPVNPAPMLSSPNFMIRSA